MMVLVNRSALEIFYQLNKSKQAAETVDKKIFFNLKAGILFLEEYMDL